MIAVLSSYGLDGDEAFHAALKFWSALHGFVLLEMTGVMDDIDTDALFSDMVLRLSAGLERRVAQRTAPGVDRRFDLRDRRRVLGGSCLAAYGA